MNAYQIRDWDHHFENNRSRERDKCSFVCIPNKQHGLGFCRIMAHKDGAAIYGIWHMITGMCSQQSLPRHGWLTDTGRAPDGHQTGTALAPEDLALKFRRPVEEVKMALGVLSSKSIGWIVFYNGADAVPPECPSGADAVPPECPRREGKEEKEGKGKKEGKGSEVSPSVRAILHDGELKRVERRIKTIRSQGTETANGKVFNQDQKTELAKLKSRKQELLTALGMEC